MKCSLTNLMLALAVAQFPPELWQPCQYNYGIAREEWLRRN